MIIAQYSSLWKWFAIYKNSQGRAGDPMKRTPMLFRIAQTLARIAHEYGIAVVVTNQGQTYNISHEHIFRNLSDKCF